MDPRFLELYEAELQHVRETAADFAVENEHAAHLGIDVQAKSAARDPFVERLLEGFAFLAARVQYKLDAEFPRFTQSLLDAVYPHYLSPLPSMGNIRIEPDYNDAGLAGGFEIPRGTAVRSPRSASDRAPITFTTAHRFDLWPVRVENVSYLPSAFLDNVRPPAAFKAKAALKISLSATAGLKFSEIKPKPDEKKPPLRELVFHIRGAGDAPTLLYEQIFRRLAGVVIQHGPNKSLTQIVDSKIRCRRVGFAPEESLLPVTPRSFEGYRILTEYFAFPDRFLYFAIEGLEEPLSRCHVSEIDIVLIFDDQELRLEHALDANSVALYCTPVINLFPMTMDQPDISSRFAEYILWPDKTRTLEFEIFDLTQVSGELENKSAQEFHPFYAAQDTGDRRPAFYTLRRVPRGLTEREKVHGQIPQYLGCNTYISLVDPDAQPFQLPLAKISARGRCTNRHLPQSNPPTTFVCELGGPFQKDIQILGTVTPPRDSFAVGNTAWRIVNHLSLNYLSLIDTDERQGAAALRDLLKLYIDKNDALRRRQIEGLKSVKASAIVRRVASPGPIAFARGLEITLLFDEDAYSGAGAYLFGSVLEQFFTKYVSLNSFTETVVSSLQRKEIMRWPAQIGRKQLI